MKESVETVGMLQGVKDQQSAFHRVLFQSIAIFIVYEAGMKHALQHCEIPPLKYSNCVRNTVADPCSEYKTGRNS